MIFSTPSNEEGLWKFVRNQIPFTIKKNQFNFTAGKVLSELINYSYLSSSCRDN